MSDLISRQAAIDALTEYGNGRTVFISVGEAVIRIEQLPSAVIRCKDCKHREYYLKSGYMCSLDTGDPYMTGRNAEDDDWFCADAERKDDE